MVLALGNFLPQRGEAPQQVEAVSPTDAANPDEEGSLSFWDLVDVVNPLQHIPVVSSIYRHFSGDQIGAPARLAGGFLFGGAIGLASSAANLGLELATGEDLGAHVMNAFDPGHGDEQPRGNDAPRVQLAAARAYGAAGLPDPTIDLPA